MLPTAELSIVVVGKRFLQLTTWIREDTLMSAGNFLKMYLMDVIIFDILYISSYLIWSVYLQLNHPLPNVGLVTLVPSWNLFTIGLWFILPSHLTANKSFRQKLKFFTFYQIWHQITIILREFYSFLFTNAPYGFQFLVPFLVAGVRELDKKLRSKIVKKMILVQDEAAIALFAVNVCSEYSFFIAIRLVGASFATVCSTVVIDFALHLKATL